MIKNMENKFDENSECSPEYPLGGVIEPYDVVRESEIMTLERAFDIIMAQPSNGSMAYAQNYTKAAMELGGSKESKIVDCDTGICIVHKPTGKMMIGEELRVQILYILSNLSGWRGEQAREVKTFLKQLK